MITKIMRRVMLLAAIAMVLPMLVAAGQSADKSTGGVEYTNVAGTEDVKASFTAQGDESDAKGRVNVRGHRAGGVLADFTGDVDCYSNTGDNTATFTGEIDEFEGEGPSGYFRISVEDGGQGKNAINKITVNRNDEPYDCTVEHEALRDVNKGNLRVHH